MKQLCGIFILTLLLPCLAYGQQESTTLNNNVYSYDVTSDPEALSANVLQILQKLPYVIVDAQDQLFVAGLSENTLCVDGFPQKLNQSTFVSYLSSMPASRVERIEIQVSRKASDQTLGDGGVINLITRKRQTDGITLEATAHGATSTLFGGNVQVNARHKGFFVDGNYAYGFRNFARMETNSTVAGYDVNSISRVRDDQMHNATLHAGWQISERDIVGASFNLFTNPGEASVYNYVYNGMPSNPTNHILTSLDGTTKDYNLAAYYKHLFARGGFAKFTYEWGKTKEAVDQVSISDMADTYYIGILNRYTDQPKEHAVRLDFSIPFNSRSSLDAGARFSKLDRKYDTMNAHVEFPKHTEDGVIVYPSDGDPSATRFTIPFDSERWTAYAQYSLNLSHLHLGVGVHWEMPYEMYSTFDESFALYPFLNVGYRFNEHNALALDYTIQRSSPQPIMNAGWMGHQWLNKLNLNYRYTSAKTQVTADAIYQSSSNSFLLGNPVNIADEIRFDQYAAEASFRQMQFSIAATHQLSERIRLRGLAMLGHQRIELQGGDEGSGTYGQVSGGADLLLPHDICLAANAGYFFPASSGDNKDPENYFYRLNLSKELFRKKLAIALFATDFIGPKKVTAELEGTTTRYTLPTNEIGVSVTYRFF